MRILRGAGTHESRLYITRVMSRPAVQKTSKSAGSSAARSVECGHQAPSTEPMRLTGCRKLIRHSVANWAGLRSMRVVMRFPRVGPQAVRDSPGMKPAWQPANDKASVGTTVRADAMIDCVSSARTGAEPASELPIQNANDLDEASYPQRHPELIAD